MPKKPGGIRVYVLIVGINRSLSYTHPSIDRHIIEALNRSPFFNVEVMVSLIHPPGDRIDNPRSREHGDLETNVPAHWGDYPLLHLSMSELESTVDRHYESFLALGDVWGDGGKSLHNILNFMAALKTTYQHYLSRRSSGVVVFCRPDILLGDHLGIRRHTFVASLANFFNKRLVIVPNWGAKHDGLNDRFAVLSWPTVEDYFCRVDQVDSIPFTREGFHSESFLWQSMANTARLRLIFSSMWRIRLGGQPDKKDLKLHQKRGVRGRMKRALKKIFRVINIS
jgi:hypothetical protein